MKLRLLLNLLQQGVTVLKFMLHETSKLLQLLKFEITQIRTFYFHVHLFPRWVSLPLCSPVLSSLATIAIKLLL